MMDGVACWGPLRKRTLKHGKKLQSSPDGNRMNDIGRSTARHEFCPRVVVQRRSNSFKTQKQHFANVLYCPFLTEPLYGPSFRKSLGESDDNANTAMYCRDFQCFWMVMSPALMSMAMFALLPFSVHSANASVQELRPSALRSELAFRALRVSDSSPSQAPGRLG